ncbi:TPM domain-containing protein [Streptomyces sp. NPDC048018]|uniref:TPM domain-containing protein n=1 Tax=Streptomyces sp. NPDC048018 TaxID=3365499 RepID=UPI00371CA02F
MTRTAARALLSVLVAACWLVGPAVPGAHADDPVVLSREGQITDRVDAPGDRRPAVVQALDRLHDARRVRFPGVSVRDFSGRPAQGWADATTDRSGLGRDDVLLAVVTHDRRFGRSAAPDAPLTQTRPDDVARTAVEPALRRSDRAGAATGAGDGRTAVPAGRPVPAPAITPGPAEAGGAAGDATSATDLVLPVVLVGGAGAIAAYAYTKRRRRTATRTTPGGGGWGSAAGGSGWGTPKGPPPPRLEELDGQARQALVATDDAVRTSQEELGFATAQFGEEAATPFTEAVRYAESELTAAFRLRQQLDDAFPEDDATRRSLLDEILRRCADVNTRLDAEAEGFDRLRDLERNAPQALESVEAAFREQAARMGTAEATLTAMRARYTESAAGPVSGDVEQAKDRLVFATTTVTRARQRLDAGDSGGAAVQIRAAEGAVDQAARLIEAVDRRAQELAAAVGRLSGALAGTEADLADARGLLEGTPEGVPVADLRGRIGRAGAVLAGVRARVESERYDPIDALRRVDEADTALDEALEGARGRESGSRRARALLDRATLTARSAVGAASDFVTTHRGAVGAEARTRLAEAQRRLERSGQLADEDPRAALAEARQADLLGRRAQELAERDVRSYGNPNGLGGVPGAGGAGGGGLGGAVLGGIILGGPFGEGRGRGGHGGGPAGGFGGGGLGGGPASFGGGGTRGRLGGGGRF